ncbi:MAG: hypothetical protein WBB48_00510 [Thermodesulfobacteriota bacterium]|jgi:preprotein translocase subunit YajC
MSSLSTALIIQILFSVVLFVFLFYFMTKNSELKKQIESKKNSITKSSEG